MNFRKGHGREELEINLIPFIDVLLVILIFMMVTTTYSKFTALQITLPTGDADNSKTRPFEIRVTVDQHGRYAINNALISATDSAGLESEIKRVAADKGDAGKNPNVIIDADAQASYQSVRNVMEAAADAGFENIVYSGMKSSGGSK